jgi:adenylate cyclase
VLLNRAAILATVAVGLAALAVLVTSLLLSRSTARLAAKTERIRHLDFSDTVPVKSRITEIRRLSDAIERMREGLEVFGRYVSKDLVTQIMRSPNSTGLGGTRRDLTVMFTDIEGFSRISESIEPELLTSRLSRYFEALGAAISGNRGMIDKYIGDSVMAFWNAPEPDPDHISNAVRAALQAADASRRLADKWRQRGRPAFRTRIGLHTGPALVGNVGARERINYTLVGAVANQASRLEGLNKIYGTDILASGEVASPTVARFVWRHIDSVVAAGTTEALEIYEPMGEIATAADHAEFLDLWRTAHEAYDKGCFEPALAGFKVAQALRPDDAPCRTFIGRCTELVRSGLPEGWDGAWHFDRK